MIEFGELVEVSTKQKVGNTEPLPVYSLVPVDVDVDSGFLDVPVFSPDSPIHTNELDLRVARMVAGYLHRLSGSAFTNEQFHRLSFLGTNPTCKEILDYVSDSQPEFDFVVPLQNPDGYILSGESFHSLYGSMKVPVLDIHDVLLHTLQFVDMGDSLLKVHNKCASPDFDKDKNPELGVAFYALAEYTTVTCGREIVSFGALNWQNFRKSYAAQHAETDAAIKRNDMRNALRWNSLRAIVSLYRRSLEIEQPDLLRRLGYEVDERILREVLPYEDTDLRTVFDESMDPFTIKLVAPKRKALERNVSKITDEVDYRQGVLWDEY